MHHIITMRMTVLRYPEPVSYTHLNVNPVYYALEAMAVNAIETEETADFVDINIPL